jgi:protein LTV1
MQHMRVVGETGDDFSATLVEAPRRNDTKGKGRERDPSIAFKEDGVGAEGEEQTYREYLESTVTEDGLRPDMDPALREILEALEDEAYVEEEEDFEEEEDGVDVAENGAAPSKSATRPSRGGNFLDALLGAGKGDYRDSRNDQDLEELFDDDELHEAEHGATDDPLNATSRTYASQVEKFKKKGAGAGDSDDEFDEDEEDFASEAGDTVAELRAASARRPPRKAAKARSSASSSAFSMSSSSMFRNDGLTTLDDRFDQVRSRISTLWCSLMLTRSLMLPD